MKKVEWDAWVDCQKNCWKEHDFDQFMANMKSMELELKIGSFSKEPSKGE